MKYRIPKDAIYYIYNDVTGKCIISGVYRKGETLELKNDEVAYFEVTLNSTSEFGPRSKNPKLNLSLPKNFTGKSVGGTL